MADRVFRLMAALKTFCKIRIVIKEVSISVNKHTFINIIKGPYILYIHWGLI